MHASLECTLSTSFRVGLLVMKGIDRSRGSSFENGALPSPTKTPLLYLGVRMNIAVAPLTWVSQDVMRSWISCARVASLYLLILAPADLFRVNSNNQGRPSTICKRPRIGYWCVDQKARLCTELKSPTQPLALPTLYCPFSFI